MQHPESLLLNSLLQKVHLYKALCIIHIRAVTVKRAASPFVETRIEEARYVYIRYMLREEYVRVTLVRIILLAKLQRLLRLCCLRT